jgi:hypothetical protein
MRRPTRPITAELKSKRRPAQGSAPDENGVALIDEPAPEGVPSRDVKEDAPASSGDTPFAASSVVSTVASNTPSTTASSDDPASSAFTPQLPEPSEPSPAAPDEPPQSECVPPSPVPASASVDTRPENRDALQTERAPKRSRRTPASSLARPVRASDRDEQADEQAAESTRPDIVPGEQESVVELNAPAQEGHPVPDGPKLTRRRTEARVPAGEGWKRRRLPKVCW